MDGRLALALATTWAIVAVFGTSAIQPWRPAVPLSNDFVSFWTGAVFVRDGNGASLFDMDAQARYQMGLRQAMTGSPEIRPGVVLDPFHSPPAQGLLLLPLTALPLTSAYMLLGLLSLAAVLLVVAVLLRGYRWGMTAAVLMAGSAPVADTLLFGQVNAEFVVGIGLGMLAMSGGMPLLGGALFGILWLKPQYAVLFAAVFVLKRRWRELTGMLATGAVLALVSVSLVGIEGAGKFVRVLAEIGAFYPPADSFIFPQSMVNWRGVLFHLWPGVSPEGGSAATLLMGAITAFLALLAWKGNWDATSAYFPRQMLATTIAAIVASPHSNFHGLVLMLGVVPFVLAKRADTGAFPGLTTPLLAVTYVLSIVIWPFKSNSWLLVPPLMALLVVLIVQCRAAGVPTGRRA